MLNNFYHDKYLKIVRAIFVNARCHFLFERQEKSAEFANHDKVVKLDTNADLMLVGKLHFFHADHS